MGRNLNPVLRREFENLDKDAESRKSAMKALKSYVKDLDSKAIPLFLAQVSETKDTGTSSGNYTISLYEVLARVHGLKIVPQIDNIMSTIIKTLNSSAGPFALHQACSKVVSAIARYGMDPTTPEEKKRHIIHFLYKPFSDSLLGSLESLSSGAALCLKALVDSDNWQFASNEMVNEVCQRVVGALGKPTQTNSHIALVMALAKHNSLIVEAYARLLIHLALRILKAGMVEGNSQKRLSAIQMVNFLMKCLDPKSIFSELRLIIEEMNTCQCDQMAFVRGAAFETLQIARRIATDRGSKYENDRVSTTKSNNFGSRGNSLRRNYYDTGDQSPITASPESQAFNSVVGYDSLIESPISLSQDYQDLDYDQRSVNHKLWKRYENDGVDVSLKDGLFSEVIHRSDIQNSERGEFSDDREDHTDEFDGFLQHCPRNGVVRSVTPSPQRSRSHINVDNIKILTTPRKLILSLQDSDSENSDFFEKQTRRFLSPSSKFEWSPISKYDQNDPSHDANHENRRDENSSIHSEQYHGSSESVSSTKDGPVDADLQVSPKAVNGSRTESKSIIFQKDHWKSIFKIICGLFVVLFGFFVCLLRIADHNEGYSLVPT